MKEWNLDGVTLRDIRNEKITEAEVDEMARLSGSYESLFSRRAMKYKELGLADRTLTENDYKEHILAEETFLKRPVVIVEDQIFIGNSKKVALEVQRALEGAK